jgi:hypothetical protein
MPELTLSPLAVRDYEFGYCTQINRSSPPLSEPVFVNVYGVQESIPSNRFSQTGSRFLDSLKGLQIRALVEGVGSDIWLNHSHVLYNCEGLHGG